MPPTRRRVLRLGAVGLAGSLAGCTSGATTDPGPTTDSESTAERESASRPADPDPSPATESSPVEFPSGPKSRPERPADLTAERVREYVRTFERRRVYNRLYRDDSTTVRRECGVDSVAERGEGFRAVVRCSAWANSGRGGTTLHADYFTRYATYFVGPDSTVRREGKLETRE